MAKITPEFARREYLRSFAGMSRLAQDAVIEALCVLRDCTTNPTPEDPDDRTGQGSGPLTSTPLSRGDQPLLKESA